MTPLKLSTMWYRRFYETAFLVSFFLFLLFVFSVTGALTLPASLSINLVSGIGISLALVGSIGGFVLVDKFAGLKINPTIPALAVFGILTASVAWLIWQTGGTTSPFLAVWALLSFVSAVFAVYGWVPILVLSGVAIALQYISGKFSIEPLLMIILASIAPMLGGILVWREQKEATDEATRNAKHLASELSEVANKSEIVINAIGDGVIAIDGKGVIALINPAAQEILGWGKQEALMLNYKSILKLNDENNHELDPTQDPIQQVLNTNQQTRANKLTVTTQSGKRVSLSLVVSPTGDPGSGVIAVFRDVTKERSEEREQAEFISTASHEMRTPVASIEGYLGLALNPNTAQIDEKARGFILKAHEAAQHLGRLFQDLLDVSKSEDGRMTNLPKVVDLASFTATITQGLVQKAQDKGLRLTFKPNENEGQRKIMPVLFVNQDNDHIREILDNLIENGIKYTPKGDVTVDIEGTDDKVIVSVKDSGLGIPAEDIPHLFQKFYRVENVDRQSIGGTGLGLYLSRRLAEAMQGRLWVESVYGKGSTFYLELPRVDSIEAERLKEQQAQQPQIIQPPAVEPVVPADIPVEATATPVAEAPAAPMPAEATPAASEPSQPRGEVKPATTVPRGESLTREQIADRVRQLEEMARKQREGASGRPEA